MPLRAILAMEIYQHDNLLTPAEGAPSDRVWGAAQAGSSEHSEQGAATRRQDPAGGGLAVPGYGPDGRTL